MTSLHFKNHFDVCTGGVNASATLVALVPTAVNVGALLDSSTSVLTPQSHLLARTIPTLS